MHPMHIRMNSSSIPVALFESCLSHPPPNPPNSTKTTTYVPFLYTLYMNKSINYLLDVAGKSRKKKN